MSNKVHTIMQIFFKSPFFVQGPKTKTKIKVSLEKYIPPQKICGHVEFLKTPSKNSPKIPKKILIKVRKKRKQNWLCENYCFWSKFIWTGNLHFWQPCQTLSPNVQKNCRSHSEVIYKKKSIFLKKSVVRYKTPLGR